METVGIHHVALNVLDLAAALAFYEGTLGFRVLDRPDVGVPGAWLQAGAHQIHLVERAEATIDPRQHVALQVTDLDAAVAELRAAGVAVRVLDAIPGAGRQAFLADPAGNRIELNQPDSHRRAPAARPAAGQP